MTDLGPSARGLLAAGRRAYRAQPSDRERIASALRARLGPESLPLPAATPAPPRVARWQLAGAALGTGLAATLVMLWALGAQPASNATPRTAAASPSARPPALAHEPLAVEAPRPIAPDVSSSAPPVQPARARPTPSSARPDALAQEVQLLARATRSMRAGRPMQALAVLDEHQRRFPGGALSEERRAARAQALCALGRITEGRAEQSQLPPRSPTAARAAQACDAAALRQRTP